MIKENIATALHAGAARHGGDELVGGATCCQRRACASLARSSRQMTMPDYACCRRAYRATRPDQNPGSRQEPAVALARRHAAGPQHPPGTIYRRLCDCRQLRAFHRQPSSAGFRSTRPRRPHRRADDAHAADAALMMGVVTSRRSRHDELAGAGLTGSAEKDVAGRARPDMTPARMPVDARPLPPPGRGEAVRRRRRARALPPMTRTMFDGMDNFWRERAWLTSVCARSGARASCHSSSPGPRGAARASASFAATADGAMREAAVAAAGRTTSSPRRPRRRRLSAELPAPTNDPERPLSTRLHARLQHDEQPAARRCGRTSAGLPIACDHRPPP